MRGRAGRGRSAGTRNMRPTPAAAPGRHVVAVGVPGLEPARPLARVLHRHDHDRRLAAGATDELDVALDQDPPEVGRLALVEQLLAVAECDVRRPPRTERLEPVVGEFLEQEQLRAVLRVPSAPLQIVARYRCTKYTDIAPSPTAEATRFIESRRTSPAANTPGTLVSSTNGGRVSGQRGTVLACQHGRCR